MFVVYALISRRLSTTAITGPMVFVTVGLIMGTDGLDLLDRSRSAVVTTLLEMTLAVVLFSDANAINGTLAHQPATHNRRTVAARRG